MDEAERAFFQTVEARITALRGKGYALSAIDAHRLAQWWQRGASLNTVLVAVESAALRARRSGRLERLSLTEIEAKLDALLLRQGSGGLEASSEGDLGLTRPWARLREVVEDVGQRLDAGPLREHWREVWRQLVAASAANEDPWAFAAQTDARLVEALQALVPSEVVAGAVERARGHTTYGGSSPRAQAEAELLAKGEAIRSYLGLPELLEILLYP